MSKKTLQNKRNNAEKRMKYHTSLVKSYFPVWGGRRSRPEPINRLIIVRVSLGCRSQTPWSMNHPEKARQCISTQANMSFNRAPVQLAV